MAKSTIKVILDTNLWISFLISNSLLELDELIFNKKIKLLFSPELIAEFIEVADRQKFKKYFSKKDVLTLLEFMDQYGEVIQVKSHVDLCRDEKDNFLLELAKDGKADYLISGDSDLLELKNFKRTSIVSWKEFLSKL